MPEPRRTPTYVVVESLPGRWWWGQLDLAETVAQGRPMLLPGTTSPESWATAADAALNMVRTWAERSVRQARSN